MEELKISFKYKLLLEILIEFSHRNNFLSKTAIELFSHE